MPSFRYWITHNWGLKVISLVIAMMLWIAIANTATSEIGLNVPLHYRNIPPELEVTNDVTDTVEVRLRGAVHVIKDITARDVVAAIDLTTAQAGDKSIALSPQNVQAPFGAEVIRVNPSSVRFTLERTLSKSVSVVGAVSGQPPAGYEVGRIIVNPGTIDIQGPESRISDIDSISTVPIRIDGNEATFETTADLDIPAAEIRLQRPAPVTVRVEIHRASEQ